MIRQECSMNQHQRLLRFRLHSSYCIQGRPCLHDATKENSATRTFLVAAVLKPANLTRVNFFTKPMRVARAKSALSHSQEHQHRYLLKSHIYRYYM